MSTHTSTPIERVEVITRGARRRWRVAQKRSIVLESWTPGVVVSALCRQHGIGSGQLSTWRREMREGKLGEPYPAVLHFAQAVVAEPTTIGRLPQPQPDSAPDQPRGNVAVRQTAMPSRSVCRTGWWYGLAPMLTRRR